MKARHLSEKVTNRIIADLEQGELTWLKPWSSGNMEGKDRPASCGTMAFPIAGSMS